MKKIIGKSGKFKKLRIFLLMVCFQGKALYAQRLIKTSAGAGCHSSYLSGFDKELRRLAVNVEEGFQAGRLNGIYFIKKVDISAEEEAWSPVFTPPDRNGNTFLNPFYYENLIELLQPVFRLRGTGVIVVDTLTHAHKLKKAVERRFPEGEFAVYNKILPAWRKNSLKENLRKEAFHYVFVTSDNAGDLDLSHISAYIRLDRIQTGNRIQEIQNFLDSHTGSNISNLFFLTGGDPASSGPESDWSRLITALSKTSVNTELNNKSDHKKMSTDQALNYLQSWKFTSGQMFSEWLRSFLRSKHFPSNIRFNSQILSDSPAGFKQVNGTPSLTVRPVPSSSDYSPSPSAVRPGPSSSDYSPSPSAVRPAPSSSDYSPSPSAVRPVPSSSDYSPSPSADGLPSLPPSIDRPPPSGKVSSLSLPVRSGRRLKLRYTALSEEEKNQIDGLIEGITGLTFTEEEKAILRLRLFTENQAKTTAAIGRDMNKPRLVIEKMEDELLSLFQSSPLIPLELRDRIRSLSKKSDSVFGYDEFSKKEQAQIDGWLSVAKERIKWGKRDMEIMDDYIFTARPKSLNSLAKRYNIHPNSVGYKTKQILTHLRDSPSVPRELRDLIAVRLPHSEKIRFKYSAFSEEEQAQIDDWAAFIKERISLTERELYFMDHYIFTKKPESLKSIGMKFNIDPTAVFYHIGRLLRNLRDNPLVPEGLQGLMRGGARPSERYFRFRYSEFSEEEQAQIDDWLTLALNRLILNETERYILDRHVFTKTPENLKDIGRGLGINPHDMTLLKRKLLQKLQKSEAVPEGLKALLPNPAPYKRPAPKKSVSAEL